MSFPKFLAKNNMPIEPPLVHGKGVKVWNVKNDKYLDFASQTLNLNLGHCHPRIVKAVKNQIDKLYFSSSRFWDLNSIKLSEELCKLSPVPDPRISLRLSGGTEANEDAIKRIRAYHGTRKRIVSFKDSMLGVSMLTQAASGKYKNLPFDVSKLKRDFIFVKRPYNETDENNALDKIESLFSNQEASGIIFEPIAVEAGVVIHTKQFLKSLEKICKENSSALALDEIQTGFGWTGKMFASELYNLRPDILTLSKSLAAGFPIGATIFNRIYDVLEYSHSEYTNGGHIVSTAAALENIKILTKTPLLKEVEQKSCIMKDFLERIESLKFVKNTRGIGMIWGLEIRDGSYDKSRLKVKKIQNKCMREGLIIRITATEGNGNYIIIKPPLVTSETDLLEGLKKLKNVIEIS